METTHITRVPVGYEIAALIPHAGKMRLLDQAIDGNAESMSCALTIQAGGLFFANGGVDAWVGIEYMAQTVAAWAGWQARLRGETPKIGLLLGSRRYECTQARFALGDTLHVTVHRQFQADNGLAQFNCQIALAGQTVAHAALTVFEPISPHDFLMEQTRE